MVKLLITTHPDDPTQTIPVVVDIPSGSVDVTDIMVFRADTEETLSALNAVVTFDASEAVFERDGISNFDVSVHFLSESRVTTITEGGPARLPHFDTPWDIACGTEGVGTIRAVFVTTTLEPLE